MLTSNPTLRYLMSENNEVIYGDYEKGHDVLFRDYSQSTYT